MDLTRTQLAEITALFEDTAEYYCDNNIISGEKFYTVLECFATAKLAELNGELAWTKNYSSLMPYSIQFHIVPQKH